MSSAKIEVPGHGKLELLEEDTWTGWFELGSDSVQVDVVGTQDHPDNASMRVMTEILPRVNELAAKSVEHLKRKSMNREKLRMRTDLKLVRIKFDTWEDYDFTMYFAGDVQEARPCGVIFKNNEIISG